MAVPEMCFSIASPDLQRICTTLSTEIEGVKSAPYWSLLAGFAAAVVGSAIAAFFAFKQQRRNRHNVSQMTALYELQDHARKIRDKWSKQLQWISGGRRGNEPFPDSDQSNYLAKLDIVISRIAADPIRAAFEDWKSYAEFYFADSDGYEITNEEELWKKAIVYSGAQARSMDS